MTTFNIYIRSYNRAATTTTYKFLDYCTYIVRKSQEQEYRAVLPDYVKVWAVEDELIDCGEKLDEFFLNETPEDIVCQLDDDINDFRYRTDIVRHATVDEVMAEIERLAQIVYDLDLGYVVTTLTPRPQLYNEPFSFCSVGGGIRIVNKAKLGHKLDASIKYNRDIDYIMQELLTNRVVICPKYFVCVQDIDTNSGGQTDDKVNKGRLDSIHALEYKWGKYFRYDYKKNTPHISIKR